ncbi:hypothetical protein EAF00_002994 [Botryotinia globosa]|nr:hypothetical protein EAF00_002994 [Botryotinia globosa]
MLIVILSLMENQIHGYADPKSTELLEVFQDHLKTGKELGASIVVKIDGENVFDVWGGFRTQDKTENWKHDTICSLFSTKKTICALALIILINRGILNISDKVEEYWAEFTSEGKSCIEIRHILSHIATKLVKQELWWKPGSASGYHAWTYEFLTDTSPISAKTFGNPPLYLSVVDSPDWRGAELGPGNGYGNALSIATILSSVSFGGEANGVRLQLNETIALIFREQSKEIDLVTGQKLRLGIGFGLSVNDTELKWLPEGRVCMWGGYGGSIAKILKET